MTACTRFSGLSGKGTLNSTQGAEPRLPPERSCCATVLSSRRRPFVAREVSLSEKKVCLFVPFAALATTGCVAYRPSK